MVCENWVQKKPRYLNIEAFNYNQNLSKYRTTLKVY